MSELKGFEPVARMSELSGRAYTAADGPNWTTLPIPLYTADQLSAVVQQRDELLKSMKYLQEYRLWVNGHAKTIIDSAIAKVQP
jgi:hypothetical protein